MIDRRGMVWTREEIEQLKQEWNDRVELEVIVEAHGRTPYAIIGQLQVQGWLVRGRTGWHRVDPDPWILEAVVRAMQFGIDKK